MTVLDVENQKTDAQLGTEVPFVPMTVDRPADLVKLREQWASSPAVPVLAADREAGIDQSWGGLDVRTMLSGEQSAGRFAVHSLVLAPGAELPSHWFDDTHGYLLVVDGEVEMGIGATTETVGRHSLGYAPPHTRQSLRNASDAPATVMAVHSPAGTDRAFRAAHELGADSQNPREYAEVLAHHGMFLGEEAQENDERTNDELAPIDLELRVPGDLDRLREAFASRSAVPRLVRTGAEEFDTTPTGATCRKELLNGDVSAGTAMFNMLSGVPGMAAPPHHQPTEEEFFFVTGGDLTVTCGTATVPAKPGAFVFAPRNCTHGFSNDSTSEAWFVTLNSPAGHERSLAMLRRLAQEGASRDVIEQAAETGGWVMHDIDAVVKPQR